MNLPDLSGRDPVLLALCGRAGSGKSSAAWFLESHYGFVTFAFADALRDMLASHLEAQGIDYAYLTEPQLKEQPLPGLHGASARQMMQTLGDWGRSIHPDYWVQCLARRAGLAADSSAPVHDRILITDVRYPNEAAWVQSHGGALLRLVRESAAPARTHSSEAHCDTLPACGTLANHGPTREGLHGLLRAAMTDLGLEPRPDDGAYL